MEAISNASWRIKAALIALVSAKLHGLAAIFAVFGMISSPSLRSLAVRLMVVHAASVIAALLFAGLEYRVQRKEVTC